MPVVKFSYPPQRAFILEDGLLKYKWAQYVLSRSQDLEKFYHDAGQFYFYLTKSFVALSSKIDGSLKAIPILIDDTEVQDIDELSDWELAEIKYKFLKAHNKL